MQKIDRNENGEMILQPLIDFIRTQSPASKLYVGCDSYKFRKDGVKHARYTTVVVVHIDGCHGCSVYGNITTEREYDKVKKRPSLRLMNEVMKTAEMYLLLADVVEGRDMEVHLDISEDPKNGSSAVVQQAIGYIQGVCNVVPMVKPNAWAASHGADRFRAYGSG